MPDATFSTEALDVDVLVVGAGNAALCAALQARESGASVLVLECAPAESRGGNTAFTAGAMRVPFEGIDDLKQLMPDLSPGEIANAEFGAYTCDDFFSDMARVTDHRANPDLVEVLVRQSFDAMRWMTTKGVRFAPSFRRQAYEIDGKFTFWGGLAVEVVGGGPGLVDFLFAACEREGVRVLYETRATRLLRAGRRVVGAVATHNGDEIKLRARSVVLACGGFEANTEWRTRYLGPGWDLAKVRGTRYNTGEGIKMALEIGASAAGNWSGAHAVAWDLNAPEFGDLAVGDGFQKHSYPLGVVVNNRGQRFLDEGADFRNYTYARYGNEILKQPSQVAWQIFDAKVSHLLRDEYRIRQVSVVRASTIEDLAERIDGIDAAGLVATVRDFNAAVDTATAFDPNVLDGRSTKGLAQAKSNWANPLDTPPYEAYAVTCGITFTFGGLRIDPNTAGVIDVDGRPIPGLYGCGELVGDLFYFNYPGGTGLSSGSVFGRIAGRNASCP